MARHVDDKIFETPTVAQTLVGRWEFHGARGRIPVEDGTVIAGWPGQHFGCRHEASGAETTHILYLRPGAIDESDEPLFDQQIPRGLRLPDLERAGSLEDDDAFDSFVFEAFEHVSRASIGDRSQRGRLRVQRMKRFIERHAFERIALRDIASSVGMSPFGCIRQFSGAMGITPQRYLSRIRLEQTKRLLAKSRLSIAEIAQRVGIRDRFYFTRWFSKEAGVPPQTFRRSVNPRNYSNIVQKEPPFREE
jgi:AraC-like DNA-binding protein